MNHTLKSLAALVIASLALSVLVSGQLFADDEKPQVRHPSYTLLGKNPPPVDSPLNPNFLLSQESKIVEGSLWYTDYIHERLVGLDVADASGDGRNEMVYATPHNVYLVRVSNGVMEQLAVYAIPKSVKGLSVDFYDTNNDGRHEIIISCQASGAGPSSIVLGYDNSKALKVLGSNIPWYLRVYGAAGQRYLAAQKGTGNSNAVFVGNVHKASFSGGKITAGDKIDLPFGVNIFFFNSGDLGPSRQNMIATVTFPNENLRVYTGGSRENFAAQASQEYCGTVNYIDLSSSKDESRKVLYLPSRIVFADIDNDGANEVIVARNRQSGVTVMNNLRSFVGGVIEAMKFNNLSLVPFFSSTNMLPGPPVDYQLADLDNNGSKDLVTAVVLDPGSGMVNTGLSRIVSYSNLYSPVPPAKTSTASK
ncbi:MAG: FG-GAP-like repeat-containing protein [Deltaproteobacteria bacterium]|jgi:hypothetical protein|nr:FG-GAP-like repeat-containing protein [Deltaproteobacteria bacterium]